jgi:prepilin-type N-terminal cleavage/methylation domain-containing protein
MHTHPFRKVRGVTLVEAMVVLSIAAILLAAGAPSFISTVSGYRLDSAHSAMRDALLLARDTARNESTAVTVCTSSNGTACTSSTWQGGFIVFRDAGTAGTVDSGDTVLSYQPAAASGITISAAVKATNAAFTRKYLQFEDDGKLDVTTAIEFTSCKSGKTPLKVSVQRGGFVSTTKGTTACV